MKGAGADLRLDRDRLRPVSAGSGTEAPAYNAIQSAVEAFSTADPDRQWTVQALADWVGIGGFGPLIVGSAQTIADELQSWVEETDVGFSGVCRHP